MARHKGYTDGIARARNGRWKLRIAINGQRIKRTFHTKEEAERVRDNLQGREKLRSLGAPLAQTAAVVALTIGSVLDGYIRECETRGRSHAHLRSSRQAGPLRRLRARPEAHRVGERGACSIKAESSILRTTHEAPPRLPLRREWAPPRGDAMSINRFRGFLYWLARLLGDVNSVEKGKVPRRIGRRSAGKLSGRLLGKLFR